VRFDVSTVFLGIQVFNNLYSEGLITLPVYFRKYTGSVVKYCKGKVNHGKTKSSCLCLCHKVTLGEQR